MGEHKKKRIPSPAPLRRPASAAPAPAKGQLAKTFNPAGNLVLAEAILQAQRVQAARRGPTPEEEAALERKLAPMQVGRRGPYGQYGVGMALPVLSQSARPLLPVVEAVSAFVQTISDSDFMQTVGGGLQGEFNEDPTFGEISVDTVVSLVPLLDQLSDARDLTAHMYFMIGKRQYDRPLRWVGLGFSLIGLIPEVGSVVKQASKYLIRGAGDAIPKIAGLMKSIQGVMPGLDTLVKFKDFLSRRWNLWLSVGLEKLQVWLAGAELALRAAPQWLVRQKDEFLDSVTKVSGMASSRLREAFTFIENRINRALDDILHPPKAVATLAPKVDEGARLSQNAEEALKAARASKRPAVSAQTLGKIGTATSRRGFRRALVAILKGNPGNPLSFLLDHAGKLRRSTAAGITQDILFENPEIIEAGHVISSKALTGAAKGTDRFVVMSAARNRLISGAVEHPDKGASMALGDVFEIAGIPVDPDSAADWVAKGLLDPKFLADAQRISF